MTGEMEVGMWERARDNDVLFSVTGLSVVPCPVHIVVIVIQTTGTEAPAFTRCTNPSTFGVSFASPAERLELTSGRERVELGEALVRGRLRRLLELEVLP